MIRFSLILILENFENKISEFRFNAIGFTEKLSRVWYRLFGIFREYLATTESIIAKNKQQMV